MVLVIPSHSSTSKRSSNQEEVVLKVWKEGFTINDGELHSINEPENREFLLLVARGLDIFILIIYLLWIFHLRYMLKIVLKSST